MSKTGCRNYLEHRLGNTLAEEGSYQENKKSGHANCEA